LTSTPPTGFTNYCRFKTTTASASIAAGDVYSAEFITEGCDTRDFLFGTASAKTVTLSFWARSSLTGNFGGNVQNAGGVRCYIFNYDITIANTWQQFAITLPGDTTGTWTTAAGVLGLNIGIDLGSGATYEGTVNTWNAFDSFTTAGATQLIRTVNATLDFTGVQIEIGSVATDFEYIPYDTELEKCRRYYEKSYAIGTKPGTSTGTNIDSIIAGQDSASLTQSGLHAFYAEKTFAPTVTVYTQSGTSGSWIWYAVTGSSFTTVTSTNNIGTRGFELYQTASGAYYYANGHWTAECAY
jgi:hypothetical protein